MARKKPCRKHCRRASSRKGRNSNRRGKGFLGRLKRGISKHVKKVIKVGKRVATSAAKAVGHHVKRAVKKGVKELGKQAKNVANESLNVGKLAGTKAFTRATKSGDGRYRKKGGRIMYVMRPRTR